MNIDERYTKELVSSPGELVVAEIELDETVPGLGLHVHLSQ